MSLDFCANKLCFHLCVTRHVTTINTVLLYDSSDSVSVCVSFSAPRLLSDSPGAPPPYRHCGPAMFLVSLQSFANVPKFSSVSITVP